MTDHEKKMYVALRDIAGRSVYSERLIRLEDAKKLLRECWDLSHQATDPIDQELSQIGA